MRSFCMIALAASVTVLALAQRPATQRLVAAGNLIQHGRYTDAIDSLLPLARDASLEPRERGRAQMLLGLANRDLWRMTDAENFYGEALDTFIRGHEKAEDYANVLDCMATLELAKGDWHTAEKRLKEAAEIDRRRGAHAGLAEIDLHLAAVALQRKRFKDAQKYLDAAHAEIPLAAPHQSELMADADGLHGWIASLRGEVEEAAAAYRVALEDCKKTYGERHPLTAWVYLLAGRSAFNAGGVELGLAQMRTGLQILGDALGTENAEYATGELAYAAILKKSGKQAEGDAIHAEAVGLLASTVRSCANCTVSVWSLRNR